MSLPNQDTHNATCDVSIVVPVFNSEATLERLVDRIGEVFTKLNRTYEIILVDDASQDGSWAKIQQLCDAGHPVRGFQFRKNHGQHFALKCGLDHSRGCYAITMDDDLQNPPEEIPTLISALESDTEVDVILGSPLVRKHSMFRNMGTWLNHKLEVFIFDKPKNLAMESFRIIRKGVIDEIRNTHHASPRIGQIILRITSRIKNVQVAHAPREHSQSGYTLRKLVVNTIDNIISYSSLPLQVVSLIGVLSAFISFILGVYYFVQWTRGDIAVSGFATLVLLLLFTSGAILFSFGIVGEYLRRIVSQQLLGSQYHVRSEISQAYDDPDRSEDNADSRTHS